MPWQEAHASVARQQKLTPWRHRKLTPYDQGGGQVLEEKDGSLGTHLRKLEDAGYLAVDKTYRDRRPLTWYQLTAAGQQHLERHVENLTRLIDRAR